MKERIRQAILKCIKENTGENYKFQSSLNLVVFVNGQGFRPACIFPRIDGSGTTLFVRSLQGDEELSLKLEDMTIDDLLDVCSAIEKNSEVREFTFYVYPQIALEFKVNERSEEEAERLLIKQIDGSTLEDLDLYNKGSWFDYQLTPDKDKETSVTLSPTIGVMQVSKK